MGYTPAHLTPYDEYLTEKVLNLFSMSTSNFINLLNILKENLDHAVFNCNTVALHSLIIQINDYIAQKNGEVEDILNSFPPVNHNPNCQNRVVKFYPPPKCAINMLIESLDGYQKTLLTYSEQLQAVLTIKLAQRP